MKKIFLLFLLIIVSCSVKDDKIICKGDDFVKLVDAVCYSVHNPDSQRKYSESWGLAYRGCMVNNLRIDTPTSDENCKKKINYIIEREKSYNKTGDFSG